MCGNTELILSNLSIHNQNPRPISVRLKITYGGSKIPGTEEELSGLRMKVVDLYGEVKYRGKFYYSKPVKELQPTEEKTMKVTTDWGDNKGFLDHIRIDNAMYKDRVYLLYRGCSMVVTLQGSGAGIYNVDFSMPGGFSYDIKNGHSDIEDIIFVGGFFQKKTISKTLYENHIRRGRYPWQADFIEEPGAGHKKFRNFPLKDTNGTLITPIIKPRLPLSLGCKGRLLVKFKHPVNMVELGEFQERELAHVKIELGNNTKVVGRKVVTDENKAVPIKDLEPGGEKLPDGKKDGKAIPGYKSNLADRLYPHRRWLGKNPARVVEIEDNSFSVPQPEAYPGLDLEYLNVYRAIDNLVVVLDVSGSMTDNDSEAYYRGGNYSPDPVIDNRLYKIAYNAIKEKLVPETFVNSIKSFTFVTFSGLKSMNYTSHSLNIETSTASERTTFFNNIEGELNSATYVAGTPVKSALQKTFSNLGSDSTTVMVVITDGSGENPGERFSDIKKITDWPAHGVMELVGYNLYHRKSTWGRPVEKNRAAGKKDAVDGFFDNLKNRKDANWQIEKHLVENKSDIEILFEQLSVKYSFKK